MLKTITIDGKPVAFKCTATTIFRYRDQFNSDFLTDAQELVNNAGNLSARQLKMFYNMAYTMAKQADPTIPDDAWEWLDNFDVFPIDEIFPQVIDLWQRSNTTLSELNSKNAVSRQ